MLLVGLAGASTSAPHQDYTMDDFRGDSADRWVLVDGELEFKQAYGRHGDYLSWLVLGDSEEPLDPLEGTPILGDSRVIADAAFVNTSMSAYTMHAIMQRVSDYVAPGASEPNPGPIALTFGENPGLGHYVAFFDDSYFGIGVPNAATGGYDMLIEQDHWGSLPAWIDSVDDRHRYTLHVVGTTLSVTVDGWPLASYTLPAVPAGTYGIAAADDTCVYAEQLIYSPFDVTPPTISLANPADATLNVMDVAVPIPASGIVIAAGLLTVSAEILDDVTGTNEARLEIDGNMVAGSGRTDPGNESWTLDLADLSPGYHDLTVEATDWAGNVATNTTRILVVGTGSPDSHTTATAKDVVGSVLGYLPA